MTRVYFVFLLIFTVAVSSCGSKQSDTISIKDIKEPCDCTNHLIIYLDEALEISQNYDSGKDIEGSADEAELELLLDRIEATQRKCEKKFESSAIQSCSGSEQVESKLIELYNLLAI